MKQHLRQKMIGLSLGYVSLALGLVLAKSKSWRVWEFDSSVVPVVSIGLWKACHVQILNMSGSLVELPVYSEINMSWVISNEIAYGQELMLLDNFMKLVALALGSMGFFAHWISGEQYPDFLRAYYHRAAIFLFLSCGFTVATVSWNFSVDFFGQTTLNFPQDFPIDKEMLTKKRLSYVLPLGITTASLSLISSAMLGSGKYLAKRQNQVKPMTYDQNF